MSAQDPSKLTAFIKAKALEIGFVAIGIAKADFLEDEVPHLESWLNAGYHGTKSYMEDNFDKRLDPRILVEGAKSVISLAINYATAEEFIPGDNYRIARFALGIDYHIVIREKLEQLVKEIETLSGPLQHRNFTDSGPVLERAWAFHCGLGWIGKNALLINPEIGSWILLAEIISDLELIYDSPLEKDFCGTCHKCIDACPTGAIIAPKQIDTRKCITCFTTEIKGEMPAELRDSVSPWIYGCDICQEVCPWNKPGSGSADNWLNPNPILAKMKKEEWDNLSEEDFHRLFKNSGVKRIGYERFIGNIRNKE